MGRVTEPHVRKQHTRHHLHLPGSPGERIADLVVGGMGSWRFIILQSIVVTLWIVANLFLLSRPFDAYPFILLNLLFSTQAAYASPLILMAANRQSSKDRARDDLESAEVEQLLQINQQQLEILRLLHAQQQKNSEKKGN